MIFAASGIDDILFGVCTNDKQRLFVATDVESAPLSNCIIMGTVVFAHDFSEGWLQRVGLGDFREISTGMSVDESSRIKGYFNHISFFRLEPLLQKIRQMDF